MTPTSLAMPDSFGDVADEFALDIQVVADLGADAEVAFACKTNDGCSPTCASACVSNG